ncbi:MAG: hypothetical protein P1V20_12370 [Verrucomicrobiales bacterium]|nr:hypothetical protein [Verrucomicrobiales bacterium]
MKSVISNIGLLLVILTVGCKDISEVEPVGKTQKPASSSAPNNSAGTPSSDNIYPISRTIADSEGRKIEVKILAKNNGEIGVVKASSQKAFVLPVTRLSEADQAFLAGLEDGGDLASVKAMIARSEKTAGRVAVWNAQFYNAEKEAERLGLPLLSAFVFNNDPDSESMENKVLYSKEFRTWANQNLALCLIRLDLTTSSRVSSISADDNRQVSSRFGVRDNITFILSMAGHPPRQINKNGMSSGKDLIDAVSAVISNPALGIPVQPIEVPQRTKPGGKGGKGGGKGGK